MNAVAADFTTLNERLERLERQDGFLRRVVLALLAMIVVGVTVVLVTQRLAPVVEAREFVLRDPHGQVRAVWTTGPLGESEIRFLDSQGGSRVSLSVDGAGSPTLAMTDRSTKYAAGLAVTDRGPQLGLYGDQGRPIFAKP
jgi:hypothetical protein